MSRRNPCEKTCPAYQDDSCQFWQYGGLPPCARRLARRVAELERLIMRWGKVYATGAYDKSDRVLTGEYNRLYGKAEAARIAKWRKESRP